jgi:hypothetical protein
MLDHEEWPPGACEKTGLSLTLATDTCESARDRARAHQAWQEPAACTRKN